MCSGARGGKPSPVAAPTPFAAASVQEANHPPIAEPPTECGRHRTKPPARCQQTSVSYVVPNLSSDSEAWYSRAAMGGPGRAPGAAIYDLVGVGFGPSNLAVAVALEERAAAGGGADLRTIF